MKSILLKAFFISIALLTTTIKKSTAQIFCDPNGSVIIYSNYDGGYLNINIDENIPNIKIGITTYEDCEVSITGTYASNVTQVIYAGYQGDNQHCNPSPSTTSVIGVNANIVDILLYPPVTVNNPGGYPYIICNYQCDSVGYQGGCNTADQISDFFLTQFGGNMYYHFTQYGCWNGTYKVSNGGNCCVGEEIIPEDLSPQWNLSISDSILCQKFCVDFFDESINEPNTWDWNFEGGSPSTSTVQNPTQICYNTAGTYDVTLITSNAYGNDTLMLTNFITVFSTPALPTISQADDILTCSPATTYQWQFNSVNIPGATDQSYTATETGFYTVVITDANGCSTSTTIYFELTGISTAQNNDGIKIYPGINNGTFTLEVDENKITYFDLSIINMLGQPVFHSQNNVAHYKKEIDLSHLPPSTYFLRLKMNNNFFTTKLIVTTN